MLVKAMGIGRQNLYDTFGDKWRLYRTAVRRYGMDECAAHCEALRSGVRAIDGIDAMLRRVVETAYQPCLGVGSICEFGVSRPDLAEVHTQLAKTLRDESRPQHREKKETMSTQTWFITGASSGLGASVANTALRAGHRVAVTARDKVRLEKLTEAHPAAVLPLSMDLTKPSEIKTAITTAEKWHGGIDVLVNNAALGYLAAIEEGEEQNIRTLFDTNVFGVASTIRAVLPGMRARASGTIINVSSLNGVVSMPALGYYSASKHALEGLTEALSQEVAPLGIKVLSIQPGGFRTGIVERNLRSPKIDAYDPTAHAVMGMLLNDKEGVYAPGDPDRMAEILVNLVKLGDMPQRLSMGADSWGAITTKLDERRAEYEQWKDLSHSTHFA